MNDYLIKPLDDEIVNNKNAKLHSIIEKLSSREDVSSIYEELLRDFIELYSNEYRHMYSEIGPMMEELDFQKRELLVENIEVFRNLIKKDDRAAQIYGNILKLSDHMSLESRRGNKSKKNKEDMEKLEKKNKELSDKYENAIIKIEKLQTQNVAILGIFSSIVIAITGGLTLFNNAGIIIDQNPANQLFVLSMCSFIIFNLVFVLMMYIRGMVDDLHSDKINWTLSFRRNWPILIARV